MTLPHINMNGTNPTELSETYQAALEALDSARELLAKTCPNGRDYCQQANGPAIYDAARSEHFNRLLKLEEITDELSALAIHCYDAAAAR